MAVQCSQLGPNRTSNTRADTCTDQHFTIYTSIVRQWMGCCWVFPTGACEPQFSTSAGAFSGCIVERDKSVWRSRNTQMARRTQKKCLNEPTFESKFQLKWNLKNICLNVWIECSNHSNIWIENWNILECLNWIEFWNLLRLLQETRVCEGRVTHKWQEGHKKNV